jgi:hypothetical protein
MGTSGSAAGLDRADKAANELGKRGRDNARKHGNRD